MTPYEETEKKALEKKELEASATPGEPLFWPPPYMQNSAPSGNRETDMYPFSSNYMYAGAAAPPNTVNVTNPQCQAGRCQQKTGQRRRLVPWLLIALGMLIVGCAGYQIGKRCGFWKGLFLKYGQVILIIRSSFF